MACSSSFGKLCREARRPLRTGGQHARGSCWREAACYLLDQSVVRRKSLEEESNMAGESLIWGASEIGLRSHLASLDGS